MENKNFILLLMFLLLIPLFIAARASSDGAIKTSRFPMVIETTSEWAEVRFEGATIKDVKVKDIEGDDLKRPLTSANAILLEKSAPESDSHGKVELEVALDVFEDVVGLVVDKGDLGEAKATIPKVGEFLNNRGSRKVPFRIRSSSEWTAVTFDGARIAKVELVGMTGKEAKEPVMYSNSMLLERHDSSDSIVEAEYLVDLVFEKEVATLMIEKGDEGYAIVDMGELGVFENFRMRKPESEWARVPFSVETIANFTAVKFDGAEITGLEIVGTEGRALRAKFVGEDFAAFLFEPGSSYARVSGMLGLEFSEDIVEMRIDREGGGYSIVTLGGRSYANLVRVVNESVVMEEGSEDLNVSLSFRILNGSLELSGYGFALPKEPKTYRRSVLASTAYTIPVADIPRDMGVAKNVRLVVETTSDWNVITFNGAYLRRASLVESSGGIAGSGVGINKINVTHSPFDYSHKRMVFDLDMVFPGETFRMNIEKGAFGYTLVELGERWYPNLDIGGEENAVSYEVKAANLSREVKKGLPGQPAVSDVISLPLTIETTSDWTEVRLEGVEIVKSEVRGTVGTIGQQNVGGNMISLTKGRPNDDSLAKIDLLLELRASSARQPGRGKLVIEKGDIGYTKVGSDFGSFVNGENVKRDPRNTRSFMFSLPVAPLPAASKEAFRNLVSYSIYAPRDADLSTEPLEYSLQAGDLPGRGSIRMRSSARVGVLSLVAMSYLMLLVLGVNILRREGYFVLGGESKAVNLQYAAAFVRKTFENIPAGSLYVLLALLLLVATAFALMVDEAAANALAIAAYFFLVAGVVLRLFGMTKSSEKIFERVDPKLLMFLVKAVAVLALLSAGVAVGYEFLGKKGLLVASLPAIIVLGVLFSYVAKRLDESQHAREW